MNPTKRQDMILHLLRVNGEVSSKELAEKFQVSMMTVHRDLKELSKEDNVQLIHGGAIYREQDGLEHPISIKEGVNIQGKKLIAEHCKSLVKPGSSVFIETGTTSLAVARELFSIEACVFYTNSLLVLNALSKYEGIHLHSVPGKYRELSKGFLGVETAAFVENLHFDVAFLGTEGISVEAGVSLPNEDDAFTKKSIMKRAKRTILVADQTKFGLSYLHKFAEVTDFDQIITDLEATDNSFQEMKKLTDIVSA